VSCEKMGEQGFFVRPEDVRLVLAPLHGVCLEIEKREHDKLEGKPVLRLDEMSFGVRMFAHQNFAAHAPV
jgi:hypothetical protein